MKSEITAEAVNNAIVSLVSIYSTLLENEIQDSQMREKILASQVMICETAMQWYSTLDKEDIKKILTSFENSEQSNLFTKLIEQVHYRMSLQQSKIR